MYRWCYWCYSAAAWNNVLERLEPAPTDIIKIREQGSGTACLLYERTANGCTIYADRPQECPNLPADQ